MVTNGSSATAQTERIFAVEDAPGIWTSSAMGELDLLDDLCRRACRDRMRREVPCHDRVRADHATLADRHATGDDHVHAEPAVVADPRGAFRGEALVRHRRLRVVK